MNTESIDRLVTDSKAFHRLFIQTANVRGGIEVTSERIFEQALCALVREMAAPRKTKDPGG